MMARYGKRERERERERGKAYLEGESGLRTEAHEDGNGVICSHVLQRIHASAIRTDPFTRICFSSPNPGGRRLALTVSMMALRLKTASPCGSELEAFRVWGIFTHTPQSSLVQNWQPKQEPRLSFLPHFLE